MVLLLSAALLTASASDNPWAISRVRLGLGNDKWAYGFSRNDDDQLSYSEHIAVESDRWFIRMDFDGITNRGWKRGWDIRDWSKMDEPAESFYNGRLDVAELKAGLRISAFDSDYFSFSISPETGLFLAGYMGFDFLQNTIHKISHIHLVDLPYDWRDVRVYGYLGADTVSSVKALRLEKSYLSISLDVGAYSAIGFQSTENASLRLSLQNDYSEFLSVSFGWKWVQEHSPSDTMELYGRYINGPYYSFCIDTGILSLRYFTELTNHFGYAVYSVDAMSFFRKSTWQENDFIYSTGISRMIGMNFNELELELPFTDHLSGVFKNRYVAGYPLDPKNEASADPKESGRMKKAYSGYTIGAKYRYPIEAIGSYITPYGEISIGLMDWNISYLVNMIAGMPIPAVDGLMHSYSFLADAELGLAFLPERLLTAGQSSICFSAFAGLSYVTGREIVTAYRYISENHEEGYRLSDSFLFRFGAMIRIGFDV